MRLQAAFLVAFFKKYSRIKCWWVSLMVRHWFRKPAGAIPLQVRVLHPPPMNNKYFIIRHGESKANVAGILLSHPKEGTVSFGLSKKGKKQVRNSILKNKKNKLLGSDIIIYSSDFLRAKETAEIAKNLLGIKKINYHKNLRERYFGKLDKTDLNNIEEAWKHDEKNANHKHKGIENPNKVLKRILALINILEKKHKNKKILLVSHGDVLQILHTHFLNKPVSHHRQTPHLETAEIRELKI